MADTAGPSSGEPAQLAPADPRKDNALKAYRKALKQHEDLSAGLKKREWSSLRDQPSLELTCHHC